MNDPLILLKLFGEFFKTGLFSVGGGMATIPFLNDMADRTGWFTRAELSDMIAVAESTPGPIGVNTATYVGFTTAGPIGGLIATLGLIAPSIIIVTLIAYIITKFKDSPYIKYTFYFLRSASIALICSAGFSFALVSLFDEGAPPSLETISIPACILAAIVFVLMHFVKPLKKLHPIVWIGACAVCGILFF